MRAAAVALVLIVGAAIVLWFGNMLNSWVLGGLIGGLAALLLSIPISLTLFSFLSRRHDQWLETMEPELEAISLARSYDFDDVEAEEIQPVYEAEVYESELPPQRERYEDRRRIPVTRDLPAAMYPHLPAKGHSQASAPVDYTLHQRGSMRSLTPRQLPKGSPVVRRQETFSQRLLPESQTYYPGISGYQGNVTRSLHQSAALHAARQEAAQRQDDVEILPTTTYNLKRIPATRPLSSSNSERQADRSMNRRISRQLPQQKAYQNQNRRRRWVDDAAPAQPGLSRTQRQFGGPRTESINRNGGYSQTGPLRRVARNAQWDEEYFDPEVSTGGLKNPLVRRAPYMYEDDALRQELAQQIDRPIVRRSSRDEEEEE